MKRNDNVDKIKNATPTGAGSGPARTRSVPHAAARPRGARARAARHAPHRATADNGAAHATRHTDTTE